MVNIKYFLESLLTTPQHLAFNQAQKADTSLTLEQYLDSTVPGLVARVREYLKADEEKWGKYLDQGDRGSIHSLSMLDNSGRWTNQKYLRVYRPDTYYKALLSREDIMEFGALRLLEPFNEWTYEKYYKAYKQHKVGVEDGAKGNDKQTNTQTKQEEEA